MAGGLLVLLFFAGNAVAEEHVRLEHKAMPDWFMLDAEYRVRSIGVGW